MFLLLWNEQQFESAWSSGRCMWWDADRKTISFYPPQTRFFFNDFTTLISDLLIFYFYGCVFWSSSSSRCIEVVCWNFSLHFSIYLLWSEALVTLSYIFILSLFYVFKCISEIAQLVNFDNMVSKLKPLVNHGLVDYSWVCTETPHGSSCWGHVSQISCLWCDAEQKQTCYCQSLNVVI